MEIKSITYKKGGDCSIELEKVRPAVMTRVISALETASRPGETGSPDAKPIDTAFPEPAKSDTQPGEKEYRKLEEARRKKNGVKGAKGEGIRDIAADKAKIPSGIELDHCMNAAKDNGAESIKDILVFLYGKGANNIHPGTKIYNAIRDAHRKVFK